ncbi:unnamed protein product [Hermetia illucens]|uniref:MYND-type domain-containing protein n=1 Tax=Hermetia illucens TaxID=343691 RepID=A0A7R8UHD9_HERIL|nr:uncharacterized protein LOC119649041 [Hermetia illucens]CAD7080930.1 unnamed protein product [Hermetia illucens]
METINRNKIRAKSYKKLENLKIEKCPDKNFELNGIISEVTANHCDTNESSQNDSNLILNTLLNNPKLKAIFGASKLENIDTECSEDTDEEFEEYIEYVFHPRKYFLQSLCQVCKECPKTLLPCNVCQMVFYCSEKHMNEDKIKHMSFCATLKMVAMQRGGHVYNNVHGATNEDFQILRVSTINICENMLKRPLEPFEKEVLLFPRLCSNPDCREWRHEKLDDCSFCKQVSYCRLHADHLPETHKEWCKQLKLFEKIITHQSKFGKIKPTLPSKILTNSGENLCTITQVFGQLYEKLSDIGNLIFYAELTQIASPALTTWFALKLTDLIQSPELVIHVIGAEQNFEVDTLQKWESFLLHLLPEVNKLDVVFVGPELNISEMQSSILQKQRLCKQCQKQKKEVNYHFENLLYHSYTSSSSYREPSLVCYFNPGLYRSTGFNITDTWPETIKATSRAKCPVLITSYTDYESVLDLKTFLRESERPLEIVLPAIVNPFRSQRPERNFVSEHQTPLIYKNYYLFLLK